MRAVLQRVSQARVVVGGEDGGAVGRGLLVLLGVARGDTAGQARWLADKVVGLRVFEDDNGKMNRDVTEVGGGLLVVSQFTLYGDCRKGRRPSFIERPRRRKSRAAVRGVRRRGAGARRAGRDRPLRRADAGGAGQRRAGDADRG